MDGSCHIFKLLVGFLHCSGGGGCGEEEEKHLSFKREEDGSGIVKRRQERIYKDLMGKYIAVNWVYLLYTSSNRNKSV